MGRNPENKGEMHNHYSDAGGHHERHNTTDTVRKLNKILTDIFPGDMLPPAVYKYQNDPRNRNTNRKNK